MTRIMMLSTGFPRAEETTPGEGGPVRAMPPRPSLLVRVLGAGLLLGTLALIVAFFAIALPIALALFAIAAVLGLLGLAFKVLRFEFRRRLGGGPGGRTPTAGTRDAEGRENVRVRVRREDSDS